MEKTEMMKRETYAERKARLLAQNEKRKTALMKQYERETGLEAIPTNIDGESTGKVTIHYAVWSQEKFDKLKSTIKAKANISDEAIKAFQKIIRNQCDEISALKEKAAAYDRLMSGGKKTLKELANFLQRPIAIQPSRSGCVAIFANVPFLGETEWRGYWMSTITCDFDFSGDWQSSLTLPDGWEAKKC